MTPEAVQTMIDQALLRNSGGGDGSHSSHENNPRNMHTARPCYYADFMKCHPLNFKGTEGVVGLTTWIEENGIRFNIRRVCCGKSSSSLLLVLFDGCCLVLVEQLDSVLKLEIELWNSVSLPEPKTLMSQLSWQMKLMVQKLHTYAESDSLIDRGSRMSISRNNQQPFKKQNVAKAYNLGTAEKKTYEGNAPKSMATTRLLIIEVANRPNHKGNGLFVSVASGTFYERLYLSLKNKYREMDCQGWVYVVGNSERNGNAGGGGGGMWGNGSETSSRTLCPWNLVVSDSIYRMDWLEGHHTKFVCDANFKNTWRKDVIVFTGIDIRTKEDDKTTSSLTGRIPDRSNSRVLLWPSEAPYRLAPSEMRNCRKQSSRAFRQRFIKKPVLLPWGAWFFIRLEGNDGSLECASTTGC
ncbi:hypothetical protein Tco_1272327 [Tanacetum coccineum]